MEPPICPLCKVRERSHDTEPGREPAYYEGESSYFSTCYECTALSGYREHSHTYYGSPAQVAAGTFAAGHSWRTAVSLRPVWEDGEHVGFRCAEFERCGWEQRFTPEEREPCPVHTQFTEYPVIKGVCVNHEEHRRERGECNERGWINDVGRAAERARSDAANWDPGRYVERV